MASFVMQNFLEQMAKGNVDLDTDSLIWILMDTGFTLDRANHHVYADVSASELSTGNGYTQKTKAAAGISITQNDSLYKLTITWNNPQWTAAGGSIGPTPGAFLLDDTLAADDLIMYIDFVSEKTEPDGGTFTIASPTFEIATSS